MMNPDNYFDDYNFKEVIEQIFKENGVLSDDNHYSRHKQEILKKVEELRKSYKLRDYFQDLPILNKDFSSFVISIDVLK